MKKAIRLCACGCGKKMVGKGRFVSRGHARSRASRELASRPEASDAVVTNDDSFRRVMGELDAIRQQSVQSRLQKENSTFRRFIQQLGYDPDELLTPGSWLNQWDNSHGESD